MQGHLFNQCKQMAFVEIPGSYPAQHAVTCSMLQHCTFTKRGFVRMSYSDSWRRIVRILRSRLQHDQRVDPLAEFNADMLEVEKKLNNLAVVKARSEAQAALIRSDLQVALDKLDRLKEHTAALPEGGAGEELDALKREYEADALSLGQRLAACEEKNKSFNLQYQNFRMTARAIMEQGEELKRRYYLADAAQAVYSRQSGLGEGGVSFEKLLEKVHDLEAQAEAAFELLPPEISFDAELMRSDKN
jgi:hypothetical protein